MPAVSVIIPSYNHQDYIGKAVQSVLNQTYSDLELIVIDDGSQDDSLRVLSTFTDSRLKIYTQTNLGAHATINRGLDLAAGEYLTILNSDDLYHPHRIATLIGALSSHKNVGLIGSYIQVVDEVDRLGGIKHGYHDLSPWALPHPEHSFRRAADLKLVLLTENYWATTSNFLFTRSLFQQVGYFAPLRYSHDWDFALRAAQKTDFMMVPEALLSYRVHGKNTIRENTAAMVYENCWILARHLPNMVKQPWFPNANENLRYSQLLNSIYVHHCENVLALLLLRDIAHQEEQAIDLLRPDNPLKLECTQLICERLVENEKLRNTQITTPDGNIHPIDQLKKIVKAMIKAKL